ncbi:MAG: FHA domain-containing protein [Phycisphaerae bacterium]
MSEINLVMFKDDERRVFPVKAGNTIVGRKTDADLRIPTRDVSREHCELRANGVVISVKDLGSSNGTFVNGKRISEAALRAGDKLGVGPVLFVVQIDGEPAKITPHDAKVEPEVVEPPPKKKPRVDDSGEFDEDDIFAEIVGGDADDDEEFDFDSIDVLDDDDD